MINLLKKLLTVIKDCSSNDSNQYRASYRIVKIEKHENDEYFVSIQLIGKALVHKTRPEEILANDKLVNSFSPTDIRNLTYLGYLGVNAPKYKILAKRLSEDSKQMIFALHKKGSKTHETLTAQDISSDKEILSALNQQDAHMVGYTAATEQQHFEEEQKRLLKESLLAEKASNS